MANGPTLQIPEGWPSRVPEGWDWSELWTAVEKGKHAFVEKPVGVDVPGVHSVMATCERARQKGLTIVSGLCWRYAPHVKETIARIQDGAIGEIVAADILGGDGQRYALDPCRMSRGVRILGLDRGVERRDRLERALLEEPVGLRQGE